jgi:acetylglutamate kinase
MEKLYVVKVGGNIIDDAGKLSSFIEDFAAIDAPKILIHGGGKIATELASKLNIPQQLVEGRRITDAETLDVITMVYAGLINKKIIAKLQAEDANAIGLSGADGNSILAHKREHETIDYGFVGDIDSVNVNFLSALLFRDLTIVLAPVTHDGKGQLLNTNADTIAQSVAVAMAEIFAVELIYCFEKEGVLVDDKVLSMIDEPELKRLKETNQVYGGMIPKLENAMKAASIGITVRIGMAENINKLINGESGTTINA